MLDDKDEKKEFYGRLEEIFNTADDAFWNDRSIVFGSIGERRGKLLAQLKRSSKSWERPGQCMYKGCTDSSIRRSHSIHQAGSLERIAENRHVLTPGFSHGTMAMELQGINLASTFPGFCERHELLFSEFEGSGVISSPRHIVLQAFRTLCREIAQKRQGITDLQGTLEQYRKAREEYYFSAVKKAGIGPTAEKLSVKGDGRETHIESMLTGANDDLLELEGDLYDQLFSVIRGGSNEPSLGAFSLSYEVPVSLSGLGVLTYENEGTRYRALCLIGILPLVGQTIAFIGAANKHSVALEDYRSGMQFGFGALNAMESWMIHGSDHWFIRPSAWNAITPTRQEKALDLLKSDEFNIGTLLEFSILDDMRRSIISYINDHIDQTPNRDAAIQAVSQESKKLTV